MKIFYIDYKHDYDNAWRRTNREYANGYYHWYVPLVALAKQGGHEVRPFWLDEMILEKGRDGAAYALRDAIREEKPDVSIFLSSEEQDYRKVLPEIQAEIAKQKNAVTLYLCVDDSWRFDSVSKHYAHYFSWIATWCSTAVPKYKALGCKNVIPSQSGVDLSMCKPVPGEKDIDVSFVGMWSKARGEIIDALRERGINVLVRGNGWPEGGVSQVEMARIMSHSKISLALNPPAYYFSWRSLARLFFRRAWLGEGGSSVKLDIFHFFSNYHEWQQKKIPQIKVRNFEIPAFKTMEMSALGDNLQDFYEPRKEIVIYKDVDDLAKKIRYYLAHPEEREAIALRGYERTLKDHSTEQRMRDIFKEMGHPL